MSPEVGKALTLAFLIIFAIASIDVYLKKSVRDFVIDFVSYVKNLLTIKN